MYWDILDKKRKSILSQLATISDDFYLAGGTALALQLGCRDSVDFDFFSEKEFSNSDLYDKIVSVLVEHEVVKTQDEKRTLTVYVDKDIKISFFAYKYCLVKPLVTTDYFDLASIEDIGCMKLSAIVNRYMYKDYLDLYWILHRVGLFELLTLNEIKFKDLDTNLVLKSLVYFDDIVVEPIIFKNGCDVSFEEVKQYLRGEVKKLV